MSERSELSERDRELLEKIEEILTEGAGEEREVASFYGFCAHLADTVPRADDAFRQRLEAHLVGELARQQEVRKVNAADNLAHTRMSEGGQRLRAWLFPTQPRWRTALAGVLTLVLVLSATTAVYEVVVKEPRPGPMAAPATPVVPRTLAEAQARVDFPIRIPTYLPGGYQQSGISYTQSENRNEQGKVGVLISFAGPTLPLGLHQSKGAATLKAGDGVREVSVNGKPAYWAEYRTESIPDSGPRPYPGPPAGVTPTVVVGHSLSWEEGGVIYELRSDAGLPLEEMLRIAESLR